MRKFYSLINAVVFTFSFFFSHLHAQTLLPQFPSVNGRVFTMAKTHDTIYLGGTFSYVGPFSDVPHGAVLDNNGLPLNPSASVNGTVNTAVPDGTGGWFIGGTFSLVGGQSRSNIARINSDGSLNSWNASVGGTVYSIAVANNTVYIGGDFFTVDGQTRNHLAAINATTGSLTPWNPDANSSVYAMIIYNNTVFAGGYFAFVGGQIRNALAAIDATSGSLLSWDPHLGGAYFVQTLALSGTTLYAGGYFSSVNGVSRNNLAAIDINTAIPTTWNPNPDGQVFSILSNGNTVYLGGSFTSIGGQSRQYTGAVDATSGAVNPWNPDANDRVYALERKGDSVYLGGSFTTISGVHRNHIASVDLTTGALNSWNPNADARVLTLSSNGSRIYAGGDFTTIGGGGQRMGIAALNAATGELLPWNPRINNGIVNSGNPFVSAITIQGNTVYIGGLFLSAGGASRNNLAAVSATTGLATPFNPNATDAVYAIAVKDNVVYAGGDFEGPNSIGGASRYHLAALDTATGAATSCAGGVNGQVRRLSIRDNTLYVGGEFTSWMNPAVTRTRLAAIDLKSGDLLPWAPAADRLVLDMLPLGNLIYTGGLHSFIGGQNRRYIAALDPVSGMANSWDPSANNTVSSLAQWRSNIIVAGSYDSIAGKARRSIAAIDSMNGSAGSWNVSIDGGLEKVLVAGDTVFVGGGFTNIAGQARSNFAALLAPADAPLPVHLLSFDARAVHDQNNWKVNLSWTTASESNSDYYVIERSSNARNYSAIGNVRAAGNSTALHTYQFTDLSPRQGISYYRLKQVDQDGKFNYSKIAVVNINSRETIVLMYPNPATTSANLIINTASAQKMQYRILDVSGREIQAASLNLQTGNNEMPINVSSLSKGTYNLVLNGNGWKRLIKFVKE
ncbi:MAG: T9SS type A sorting domain-containing protein [Flavisolibacter sp.]